MIDVKLTPKSPKNVTVSSPYLQGVLDIEWDPPNLLPENEGKKVLGVNIYRSYSSDRGPYTKINEFLIGGTFFRDQTQIIKQRETVKANYWLSRGDSPNDRRWVFQTRCPIVKPDLLGSSVVYSDHASDVRVWIDNEEVEVHEVFGSRGQVTLVNMSSWDYTTEDRLPATLPKDDSIVEIEYYSKSNHVKMGFDLHIFYKVTTVCEDLTQPGKVRETPLEYCRPATLLEVEGLDYIWREAVRRNQWILQQGGERVNVFIRKQMGERCSCSFDERTMDYSKQPENPCLTCFGTGLIGGYDGPFPTIIAVGEADRTLEQTPYGRKMDENYEVFMGPTPLITQRDFVVKQTNERYSIGPVRRPTNRGNLLQQHFTISYLPEQDIRYRVPITGARKKLDSEVLMPVHNQAWIAQPPYPLGEPLAPTRTDKADQSDRVEEKGRTRVWENINY